jgi:hypothetical protein
VKIVLVDIETFRERRRALARPDFAEACKALIDAGNGPYFCIGEHSMQWECPGCGHVYGGRIGSEAIGGWENPQWVVSGIPDKPTLSPSLGCGAWHRGECSAGHWWLRDGELVPA